MAAQHAAADASNARAKAKASMEAVKKAESVAEKSADAAVATTAAAHAQERAAADVAAEGVHARRKQYCFSTSGVAFCKKYTSLSTPASLAAPTCVSQSTCWPSIRFGTGEVVDVDVVVVIVVVGPAGRLTTSAGYFACS